MSQADTALVKVQRRLLNKLVRELKFVLARAAEMGCNCGNGEHQNKECPGNPKYTLWQGARAAISEAEKTL